MQDFKILIFGLSLIAVIGIGGYFVLSSGEKIYEEELEMVIRSNTEYWPGQLGEIISELRDRNYNPVSGAVCTYSVLYPDKSSFIDGDYASGTSSFGTYYYNFVIPDEEGVYEYSSTCVKNSRSYTAGKAFTVRPYFQSFSFEGQYEVRPGEYAVMGWRSPYKSRSLSNVSCNIPGNITISNDNTSFYWTWYVDPLVYKPGNIYNITCGSNYFTSVSFNYTDIFYVSLFNETWEYADNVTTAIEGAGVNGVGNRQFAGTTWNATQIRSGYMAIEDEKLNLYSINGGITDQGVRIDRTFSSPFTYFSSMDINDFRIDYDHRCSTNNYQYQSYVSINQGATGLRFYFDIEDFSPLLASGCKPCPNCATNLIAVFNSTNTTPVGCLPVTTEDYVVDYKISFRDLNTSTGSYTVWLNDTYLTTVNYEPANISNIRIGTYSNFGCASASRWNITVDDIFVNGDSYFSSSEQDVYELRPGGSVSEFFRVIKNLGAVMVK